MNKIEKQNLPVFHDENGKPIAAILYIKGQRIIHILKPAGEEELIELYEKREKTIKTTENEVEARY